MAALSSGMTPCLHRPGPDCLDGRAQIRWVPPDVDEHAVSHTPRHAQGTWPSSGNPHRHRQGMLEPGRTSGLHLDLFPCQQAP